MQYTLYLKNKLNLDRKILFGFKKRTKDRNDGITTI